ncbi:MAG: MarR family transcriptional regulator [Pseudomonadota bacterium]
MVNAGEDVELEARFCFGTYRLNRAFARFYQNIFAETGLTYPKYVILSALHEYGNLSVSELSERAGVESNTLSPLLKKMAEFGVISRQRDEKDERRVVLALTDFGRNALSEATKAVNDGFRDLGFELKDVEHVISFMKFAESRLDASNPDRLSYDAVAKRFEFD